jgi:hypothetical protein
MDSMATTPANKNLFEVCDNIAALQTEDAKFCHAMVARLLFLCKPECPDLQTAIAFLCTWVQAPKVDNQRNFSPVIKYLRTS